MKFIGKVSLALRGSLLDEWDFAELASRADILAEDDHHYEGDCVQEGPGPVGQDEL